MSTPNDSLRSEIGIRCLNCGLSQIPPNREMHNWSCANCFSGFISIVMLTNLVTRDLVDSIKEAHVDRPAGRKCVMCHLAMEVVDAHYQGKDARIEYCRKCHLCWFDSGDMGRVLRRKPDENRILSDDEIAALKRDPHTRPRAKRAPTARPVRTAIPRAALTLLAISLFSVYSVSQEPGLVDRFGLLPIAPLRQFGATWLTSLLLEDHYSVNGVLALLLFGTIAERRLGTVRFLKLFFLSGVAGRVGFILGGIDREAVIVGGAPALFGIGAYVILSFPLREYFWPDPKRERWRKSQAPAWFAIAGCTILMFTVLWDYVNATLHSANLGYSDPRHLARLTTSFVTPAFRQALAAGTIGMFWQMAEADAEAARERRRAG